MSRISTILWIVVLIWGVLSIADLSTDVYGNGILEKIQTNSQEEGFTFNAGMALYTGAVITPTLSIDEFPSPIEETYGAYCRIFLPDGYIAIAGLEWFLFLLVILIITTLIVYPQKRKKMSRGDQSSILWGFLVIFLLIILLYPIWNAIHIIGFEHFYALTTGSTAIEAHSFYVGLAESMSAISLLLILIVVLSMTKLGSLGMRTPKVIK